MKTPPALIQSTAEERASMLADGMVELTPAQLRAKLNELGYAINPACTFSYVNRASPPNARRYLARSVSYVHKASGLSFANVKAPRDTLPELQALRRWSFCFHRGRVWEL